MVDIIEEKDNITGTASQEMADKTLKMTTNIISMAKIISLFVESKTDNEEAKQEIKNILNTMVD